MNLTKILRILRLSPKEAFEYFEKLARKVGYSSEDIMYEPNVFLALRGSDIGFVAHVDTVWDTNPSLKLAVDTNRTVLINADRESFEGIGADDRLGIYILDELLCANKDFRPSIFLCNYEEIGGYGARILDDLYPANNVPMRALIELDRKGANDAVFYKEPTPLFKQIVLAHGFKEAQGSFSDISFLEYNPVFRSAPSVNLSTGYAKEHTPDERIYINQVDSLIPRIKKLYEDLLHEERKITYARKRFNSQIPSITADCFNF